MSANPQSRLWLLAAAVASLSLGACSSVTDRTRDMLYAVTPYKVEVVQGNFVSKEQVEALKPGMSRQQVREILGTSLLTDVFHSDRWDYVFTIRRQGVELGDEFFLARHRVAFEVIEHFAVEIHRQMALLGLDALAPDREDVVPSVAVEHIRQQRGAEDFAHLLSRHARLERGDLLLGHEITLHDFGLVGRHGGQRAARAVRNAAACGQAQACKQHGCQRAGSAWGDHGHGGRG